MKRSVSWIEFLITLGIFILIILWIFNRFIIFTHTLSKQFQEFSSFQESIAIASYLLSFKNLSVTNYTEVRTFMKKRYKNPIFRYRETPYVIFLKEYPKPTCSNCVEFFYNTSRGCYELYQNSTINTLTTVGIILYSYNFPTIFKINNPQVICYNFLNVSIVKLGNIRTFRYCDIILYKNTGVFLCNINNLIILDRYQGLPTFYVGNMAFIGQGSNFMFPTQTLSFFKYENSTISNIFLSID